MAKTTIDGVTYTARLVARECGETGPRHVDVYVDGVWAGRGYWDSGAQQIRTEAILIPEEAWAELDSAIAEEIAEERADAASEITTARLGRLADPRAPRPGRCSIEGCTAPGKHWYRTDLTPAGTRAVRACDRHESLAERLLDSLTMADAVRLATRAERRRAREAAALADQAAQAYRRTSALLAGASSATHTYALLAGAAEREAECQRAFLAALAAAAT